MKIPNNVVSIGDYAFSNCGKLTYVEMPSSVVSIGMSAFSDCGNLINIMITESVITIGCSSFEGTLDWKNHPDGLVYIDGWACGYKGRLSREITLKEGTRGIADNIFQECIDLQNVVIPNGVVSIGRQVFQECTGLTSLTIPSSVRNIGDFAFFYCTSLREVHFQGNAPNVETPASLYYEAARDLTTYVLPGSKGWDGNPDSTALPEHWCERKIAHLPANHAKTRPAITTQGK